MAQNVLVLSPHPDDESIGCGGTLCKHVVNGDVVHVVVLTSGEAGGHGLPKDSVMQVREEEAREAARILGLQRIDFWRQPDGQLQAEPPLVERLREYIANFNPQLIYVPHPAEMHPDHRAAARLVENALTGHARIPESLIVRMYEVWTPLQQLDEIVDISEWMDKKLEAVRAYKSQCDVLSFDEAIRGLNRYRGEMHSWPGGDYAEVFQRMLS